MLRRLARWWFCEIPERHRWSTHRCIRCLVLRPSILEPGRLGRVRRGRGRPWRLRRIWGRA